MDGPLGWGCVALNPALTAMRGRVSSRSSPRKRDLVILNKMYSRDYCFSSVDKTDYNGVGWCLTTAGQQWNGPPGNTTHCSLLAYQLVMAIFHICYISIRHRATWDHTHWGPSEPSSEKSTICKPQNFDMVVLMWGSQKNQARTTNVLSVSRRKFHVDITLVQSHLLRVCMLHLKCLLDGQTASHETFQMLELGIGFRQIF